MPNDEREPFYVGEYQHTIDTKHRITVPKKWRFQGDEADIYVAWARPEGYVAVYPPNQIKIFRDKINQIPESDPRKQVMLRRLFGKAHQFGCDGNGRIMLSDKLVEQAQLKKNVTLVGLGETFSIWSTERYQKEEEDFDVLEAMQEFGIWSPYLSLSFSPNYS